MGLCIGATMLGAAVCKSAESQLVERDEAWSTYAPEYQFRAQASRTQRRAASKMSQLISLGQPSKRRGACCVTNVPRFTKQARSRRSLSLVARQRRAVNTSSTDQTRDN